MMICGQQAESIQETTSDTKASYNNYYDTSLKELQHQRTADHFKLIFMLKVYEPVQSLSLKPGGITAVLQLTRLCMCDNSRGLRLN